MNRRGLLGMFAAGVSAAILPSGIIMPVRQVITPNWVPQIGIDIGSGSGDRTAVGHWCDDGLVVWRDYPRKPITADQLQACLAIYSASRFDRLMAQHLQGAAP